MWEFKKIQEIFSNIGTEFFQIDEEMTEKNEVEDDNSISLKSPWHNEMRQTAIPPIFCMLPDEPKMQILYLKEIYAQFVETNRLVKHNIYQELEQTIMDLDLQITWKHPVYTIDKIFADKGPNFS